ncbi:TMEM43 family protein [Roseibacillus ishigakijimensis]|uniref:TMEM43 family protein n=1 Tax=Roseibacillus ishigakijimensis TaxID=454146 RepID=A0A934RUX3_9BACT|nr:TMEM43 family protein [Roseibacillus ishigakijimensis]
MAGLVLALVAVVMLVANERNAVRDLRANSELGREVVSIPSETIDASKEGQLVHLTGQAKTGDRVANEEFGISEEAVRLRWQAEIFQWTERSKSRSDIGEEETEGSGAGYVYEKKWLPEAVDSSEFVQPGHENPGPARFRSGAAQAETVTVGAFRLPPALIAKIASEEPYALAEIPTSLADESARLHEGAFYTGDPEAPAIGDERVSFTLTRPGPVSVMAVQEGGSFVPFRAKNGKTRFLLSEGTLGAEEMVQQEEKKAAGLRWGLRVTGFILMTIGLGLVLKPLSVLADLIPLLGNLVGALTGIVAALLAGCLSLLIIALSWVTFRPLIAIPLLLGAGVILFFAVKILRRGQATPPPQPVP